MFVYETEELNEMNPTPQLTDKVTDITPLNKSSKFLTKEEEVELGFKSFSGDIEARNELINANYRLVAKIAHNYTGAGIPFDDLFQEGCIGLITAASKFDPNKGCRFATFATIWIKKYIIRSSFRSGFSTKIPRRLEPYVNKVLSFSNLFEMTNHRAPSVSEISSNTQVPPDIVEDILYFSTPLFEFDDRFETPNAYIQNSLASYDEDCVVHNVMKEELEKILELVLTEKEKYILRVRFYSNSHITKEQIARHLNMTVNQIIHIERTAYKKLREYFAEHNLDFHDFISNTNK